MDTKIVPEGITAMDQLFEAPVAVAQWDLNRQECSCCDSFSQYALSLMDSKDILHHFVRDSGVHPEDRDVLEELFDVTLAGQNPGGRVVRLKSTAGNYLITCIAIKCSFDAANTPQRITVTLLDVEEKAFTHFVERSASGYLHSVFEKLPVGIAIFEVGERIIPTYISSSVCNMMGFERRECDERIASRGAGGL